MPEGSDLPEQVEAGGQMKVNHALHLVLGDGTLIPTLKQQLISFICGWTVLIISLFQ